MMCWQALAFLEHIRKSGLAQRATQSMMPPHDCWEILHIPSIWGLLHFSQLLRSCNRRLLSGALLGTVLVQGALGLLHLDLTARRGQDRVKVTAATWPGRVRWLVLMCQDQINTMVNETFPPNTLTNLNTDLMQQSCLRPFKSRLLLAVVHSQHAVVEEWGETRKK